MHSLEGSRGQRWSAQEGNEVLGREQGRRRMIVGFASGVAPIDHSSNFVASVGWTGMCQPPFSWA